MANCQECSAELVPGARFCRECGASVDTADAQPTVSHPPTTTEPAGTETSADDATPASAGTPETARSAEPLRWTAPTLPTDLGSGQDDEGEGPAVAGRESHGRRRFTPFVVFAAIAVVAIGAFLSRSMWQGTGSGSPTSTPSVLAGTEGVVATDTTTTAPVTTATIPGDLGLATPIALPVCDGSFVTFIGSSVEPQRYVAEVSAWLVEYSGSSYLRTDVTGCSSLRQELRGQAIYSVFFGPFATFAEACSARFSSPNDAYVKRLDNVSDPNEIPECP